jgi:hypothetical protein
MKTLRGLFECYSLEKTRNKVLEIKETQYPGLEKRGCG